MRCTASSTSTKQGVGQRHQHRHLHAALEPGRGRQVRHIAQLLHGGSLDAVCQFGGHAALARKARDAVMGLTPAALATSLRVMRPLGGVWCPGLFGVFQA